MKIVDNNPALLTNLEVLAVLKDRASDEHATVLPSEVQVSEALQARVASLKSSEELQAFTAAITKEFQFKVNKEELLQLLNHAPANILEAFLCLDQAITDKRLSEDDLDRVVELVGIHLRQ